MEKLPNPLICLTIEHLIDDVNAIEKYLAEYPEETERCLPVALRNVVNEYAVPAGFPAMGIPSPGILATYLQHIWGTDQDINDKLYDTTQIGLNNLVPYFLAHGATITRDIMCNTLSYAVIKGNVPLIKILLYPPQGRAAVYRNITKTCNEAMAKLRQMTQERGKPIYIHECPLSLQAYLQKMIGYLRTPAFNICNREQVSNILNRTLKEIQ